MSNVIVLKITKFSVLTKSSIDYKKIVNYQVFNIFENYENEYIYSIIIEKNEIERIFNVE